MILYLSFVFVVHNVYCGLDIRNPQNGVYQFTYVQYMYCYCSYSAHTVKAPQCWRQLLYFVTAVLNVPSNIDALLLPQQLTKEEEGQRAWEQAWECVRELGGVRTCTVHVQCASTYCTCFT